MRMWLVTAIAGLLAWSGVQGLLPSMSPAVDQAAGATVAQAVRCSRFPARNSTAFDPATKKIALPWRGDLPATLISGKHAWDGIALEDWQAYMAAVLSEIRAANPKVSGKRLSMDAGARWWISPWMDFGAYGREPLHGLTQERGPDEGDLSPHSPAGLQIWAVGFYNAEGAYGLNQVFADPCDPKLPKAGWTFPDGSASFKFLFTNADAKAVPYLAGAPEIEAYIEGPGGTRTKQVVRLIQVDIAVRSPKSPTQWAFGTYIWQGPAKGDGLLDNLVPVGLMWGNDPNAAATPRDEFAALSETRLNPALAGIVWRGKDPWPTRPWPGFQGRLNGPADNFRSSCLSCHALAQWPRSPWGIVPTGNRWTLAALDQPGRRDELRERYMRNVPGGTLTNPMDANGSATHGPAVSLDYSLQIEAGLTRLCSACKSGALTGPTPAMCKVRRPGNVVITTPSCGKPTTSFFSLAPKKGVGDERPPRQ